MSLSAVDRVLSVSDRARLNYAEQGVALADAQPHSFTMHHPGVMSLWTVPAHKGSIANCAVRHGDLSYNTFVHTSFQAFLAAGALDGAITIEITEPAPVESFTIDLVMWESLEVFALAHGYRCVAELPVMVIDPGAIKHGSNNPDLFEGELRCEDTAWVGDVTSIASTPSLPESYLTDERVFTVSSKDGRGHGILFVDSNRTGGIYWVEVAAGVRGQGLGQAITRQLLLIAYQLDLRLVVLQSSRLGWPVYNRVGFREILRYRQYSLPEGIDAANWC